MLINLDLKVAYEQAMKYASNGQDITITTLKNLASIVMKNIGATYNTSLVQFSSANGDLRLLNVAPSYEPTTV